MDRTQLLAKLKNLFAEVLTETSFKIGATNNVNTHLEILASVQAQIGRGLCPLVGTYKQTAVRAPPIPPPRPIGLQIRAPPVPPPRPNGQATSRHVHAVYSNVDPDIALEVAMAVSLEESKNGVTRDFEAKYTETYRQPSLQRETSPDVSHIPSYAVRYEQSMSMSYYQPVPATPLTEPWDCLDFANAEETPKSVPDPCSVCQDTIATDDPNHAVTACFHHFHQDCLTGWIASEKAANPQRRRPKPFVECPVCRMSLCEI